MSKVLVYCQYSYARKKYFNIVTLNVNVLFVLHHNWSMANYAIEYSLVNQIIFIITWTTVALIEFYTTARKKYNVIYIFPSCTFYDYLRLFLKTKNTNKCIQNYDTSFVKVTDLLTSIVDTSENRILLLIASFAPTYSDQNVCCIYQQKYHPMMPNLL